MESELNKLQDNLDKKKSENEGKEILRGDALKQYVNMIKAKSNKFKRFKLELNEIRTERGILSRTLDLLEGKERALSELLNILEEERGIQGYFLMKEQVKKKNEVSGSSPTQKTDQFTASESMNDDSATFEELTLITKKLSDAITAKKNQLAPIIKDLRPMRQRAQDLQQEAESKKSTYDTTAATLESNLVKLDNEVKRLSEEKESLESKEYKIKCELEVLNAYEDLMKLENQLTVVTSTVGGKNSQEDINLTKRGFM